MHATRSLHLKLNHENKLFVLGSTLVELDTALMTTDLTAGTVAENLAAGEARAALPTQMRTMVRMTRARPVLGARGRTIAFLRSTEMASSVNTELETER